MSPDGRTLIYTPGGTVLTLDLATGAAPPLVGPGGVADETKRGYDSVTPTVHTPRFAPGGHRVFVLVQNRFYHDGC